MAGRRGRMKMNPNFLAEAQNQSGVSDAVLKNARRTGQLNISNRSLTELPPSIFRLNEPPSSGNRSTLSFDDAENDKWWEGTEMTKLVAASNRIRYVTEELSNLKFLTHLDLYDNEITALPSSIGELTELRHLNVSINRLQALPDSLCRCSNLINLDIHRNTISVLPRSFGELSELEFLDVSENDMTDLPESITRLRRLRQFRAKKNKLHTLPDSIYNLTALVTLDLSSNKLASIPPALGELSRLEILDLRQNALIVCPNLSNCTDMKELYLGENNIAAIDYSICRLPNLMTLDFHFNKVSEIPMAITALQNLVRLDLGNNDITGLPHEIGMMTNLQILVIDGNPMRSIRRDIINRGTEAVKKYLLSRMKEDTTGKDELTIKEKGTTIGGIGDPNAIDAFEIGKSLSLDLANKNLSTIEQQIWAGVKSIPLKTINLKRNKFNVVPQEVFSYSKYLLTLDLSVNKLAHIPNEIGLLEKLQHLDLSSNRIATVPQSMENLKDLRHIDLSLNAFKQIPAVVLSLSKLEHLFCNSNDVSELEVNSLIKLSHLKTLDLQNNNIEQLPPELGLCEQLTCLKLDGNRFRVPRPALLAKGTVAVLEYLRGRIVID